MGLLNVFTVDLQPLRLHTHIHPYTHTWGRTGGLDPLPLGFNPPTPTQFCPPHPAPIFSSPLRPHFFLFFFSGTPAQNSKFLPPPIFCQNPPYPVPPNPRAPVPLSSPTHTAVLPTFHIYMSAIHLVKNKISQGADSVYRCHLASIGFPIIKIRWSCTTLICIVGIPILVWQNLDIESVPDSMLVYILIDCW